MPRKGQGCFNPLRDILAAPYFPNQAAVANHTYSRFNASYIPSQRLAFFAGDIRPDQLDYSGGVRQVGITRCVCCVCPVLPPAMSLCQAGTNQQLLRPPALQCRNWCRDMTCTVLPAVGVGSGSKLHIWLPAKTVLPERDPALPPLHKPSWCCSTAWHVHAHTNHASCPCVVALITL
jgi:hypothetical protein